MYKLISRTTSQKPLEHFVRFIRSKQRLKQVDPGIRLRKLVFNGRDQVAGEKIDYDELEADFNNLGMTHTEHVREIEAMKEKEKFSIIKQKYFKEKHPNFLTWADKQQIKHLNSKDPEEWTVEKLAEGFPALPETIKKLIKSNWSKNSETKIRNHDTSVGKNWELFKNGELELPPDLSDHLEKFSNRKLKFNVVYDSVEKPKVLLPQGEFSEIITSYEKMKRKDRDERVPAPDTRVERKPLKEMYLREPVNDLNQVTLNEYRQCLKKQSDLSMVDKSIVQHEVEEKSVQMGEEVELNIAKFIDNAGQVSTFGPKRDYNHLIYPEKILIPKDKRKRGCTYKLSDCYYDDDGEFLYRVPGME